jgi:esterase/lipase superfamily enzyme
MHGRGSKLPSLVWRVAIPVTTSRVKARFCISCTFEPESWWNQWAHAEHKHPKHKEFLTVVFEQAEGHVPSSVLHTRTMFELLYIYQCVLISNAIGERRTSFTVAYSFGRHIPR